MKHDSETVEYRNWDISVMPRLVFDVRAYSKASVRIDQELTTPNNWSTNVDGKWSNDPAGFGAAAFTTPVLFTAAAAGDAEVGLDVDDVAYLVLERAAATATSQILKVCVTLKSAT